MIIYLDVLLLMVLSKEEISMCRDTVIFLLQITSIIASKITMSVAPVAANIIFKGKSFISATNSSEPPMTNIITMKDDKSISLQCSIIDSASCTISHTDRCLNNELGGHLRGYIYKGNVVSPGNVMPHQYSRVISSKTSNTDIHKMQGYQNNTSSKQCIF